MLVLLWSVTMLAYAMQAEAQQVDDYLQTMGVQSQHARRYAQSCTILSIPQLDQRFFAFEAKPICYP